MTIMACNSAQISQKNTIFRSNNICPTESGLRHKKHIHGITKGSFVNRNTRNTRIRDEIDVLSLNRRKIRALKVFHKTDKLIVLMTISKMISTVPALNVRIYTYNQIRLWIKCCHAAHAPHQDVQVIHDLV